jgi:DNA-binding FadR family transcriptional regulator
MLDHRRLAMGKPGAIERSLEDHRRIVAALKARDPKAVSAAFSRHILRIHDTSRAVDVGAGIGWNTLEIMLGAVDPATEKETI